MHTGIQRTHEELAACLATPGDPLLPELDQAIHNPETARDRPTLLPQ